MGPRYTDTKIFKVKGGIVNCSYHTYMKGLENGMKVVEEVVAKTFSRIVNVNKRQFGFMTDKGTIDAVFI